MEDNWNIVTPTPLPEDQQKVEWVNDNGDQKKGIYIAEEGMFAVTDPDKPTETISDFDFDFNVEKWRALPFVILAAIAAYIYLT